jgi:thiol-disulfide isomerase/thioredoxin
MLTKSQIVILIISGFFVASIKSVKQEVLVYRDAEFKIQLTKHKIALVAFYAPWCYYSKKLLPEYDSANNILRNILKQDVSLIKIDCYDSENKDLCTRENIPGYPTIKIFKDGVYYKDYGLQRTADQLVYFALDLINGVA